MSPVTSTTKAGDAPEAGLLTQQSPTRSVIPQTPQIPDAIATPLRLPNTDWLHHRLTISGSVEEVHAFRTMACGSGVIPWVFDLSRMEEDWFHLLAAPPAPQDRTLSVAGARILAGQLREAVGRRHDLALAQATLVKRCPFDLHALLPVPDEMLRRGPDDPAALHWMWQHWGTTQALRHVTEELPSRASGKPRGLSGGEGFVAFSFWSADWTPWRAIKALRECFLELRFDVRPTYDAA